MHLTRVNVARSRVSGSRRRRHEHRRPANKQEARAPHSQQLSRATLAAAVARARALALALALALVMELSTSERRVAQAARAHHITRRRLDEWRSTRLLICSERDASSRTGAHRRARARLWQRNAYVDCGGNRRIARQANFFARCSLQLARRRDATFATRQRQQRAMARRQQRALLSTFAVCRCRRPFFAALALSRADARKRERRSRSLLPDRRLSIRTTSRLHLRRATFACFASSPPPPPPRRRRRRRRYTSTAAAGRGEAARRCVAPLWLPSLSLTQFARVYAENCALASSERDAFLPAGRPTAAMR